jgi:hypothetical protein
MEKQELIAMKAASVAPAPQDACAVWLTAKRVEANVMEELPQVAHVIVHVDPWESGS